jgi:hypothetical protein
VTSHEIPRLDQPSSGAPPRAVQFHNAPVALHRRGFLTVVSAAALTLGLTMLSWIPLARPARALQGTEYPDCGRYSNGPEGQICHGAPYSPSYCGTDNWFKYGCFDSSDGARDCYQPRTLCRAGEELREAWRWEVDGRSYRCADGEIQYHGAPNPELVICNALLTQPEQPQETPQPEETPQPGETPQPEETPSSTPRAPWSSLPSLAP